MNSRRKDPYGWAAGPSRRRVRAFGKRHLDREARRRVGRVLELHQAGRSERAIATSTGLSLAGVSWILQRERELRGPKPEEARS